MPGPKHGIAWARNGVISEECPVSYITAESLCWLEEYAAWTLGGKGSLRQLEARTVDAFLVIEKERWKEEQNGYTHS